MCVAVQTQYWSVVPSMVTFAEQVAFPAIFSATHVYTPESVVMVLSKVKVQVSGGS